MPCYDLKPLQTLQLHNSMITLHNDRKMMLAGLRLIDFDTLSELLHAHYN